MCSESDSEPRTFLCAAQNCTDDRMRDRDRDRRLAKEFNNVTGECHFFYDNNRRAKAQKQRAEKSV